MMDTNDPLTVAAQATGGLALIALLFKKVIVDLFKGKSEIAVIQAGDELIVKYKTEIGRLEEIVKKLQTRVEELESKFEQIHTDELQDAADIAELTILLDTVCKDCINGDDNARMLRILDRFRERMATRRK